MDLLQKKYQQAKIYKNKVAFIEATFKEGYSVLDVGFFGQGVTPESKDWGHALLKKQVSYVFGIDICEEANLLPKDKYAFEIRNAENFDYSNKFNIIYAGDLIEHLSNPGLFLESCKKSLAKEGKIIVTTPNPFNLFNIIEKLFRWEPTVNSEHVAYYNLKTFNALLSRYNLEIEKVAFLYELGVEYERSLAKRIQDVLYFLLSKLTNKYLETIIFFVKEIDSKKEV